MQASPSQLAKHTHLHQVPLGALAALEIFKKKESFHPTLDPPAAAPFFPHSPSHQVGRAGTHVA
jgi:hypothetical protein